MRSILYLGLFVALLAGVLEFREQHPDLVWAWTRKGAIADLVGPILLLIGACAGLHLAKRWRGCQLRRFWIWGAPHVIA
ncbi:MAG: hypothetical protein IT305_02295 [Chloroflexi bacterium]|nr:hypothetical protein [Chloroflexota bacterium]